MNDCENNSKVMDCRSDGGWIIFVFFFFVFFFVFFFQAEDGIRDTEL